MQQHARRGAGIAEPLEDARVDVLEEILEIGGVGSRWHEGHTKQHAIPHVCATQQPTAAKAEGGSNEQHGDRQHADIAGYHVVKPQTFDEGCQHARFFVGNHAAKGDELY